jgi:hypothetical protein
MEFAKAFKARVMEERLNKVLLNLFSPAPSLLPPIACSSK